MMAMDLYITKLGGSAITDKEGGRVAARDKTIARVAREIRGARREKEFRLVVVHGAGPFGHNFVEEYGIGRGVKTRREVEGFVRTHNSMEDLNKRVSDIFRENGLLGFPVQPSACIVQRNREIAEFNTGIIKKLIGMDGFVVPILYGDVVVDEKLGASVISGDVIAPYLARSLHADSVFFGTDVDGVYSGNPKEEPGARIIKKIDKTNFEGVMRGVGGSAVRDVTSGMRGKLESVEKYLSGTRAVVFNLNTEGSLCRLLKGETGIGTEIMF